MQQCDITWKQCRVDWDVQWCAKEKENVVSNFCALVYKAVDVYTARGRQSNAIDLVIATVSCLF